MATRKFRCKVCGYVHEGDSAPDICPICKAPASEFEEIFDTEQPAEKKKGINTNSNTYIIIYSVVMVVIVAFLLAFIYSSLKATQEANVQLDTKKQILASLNIREFAGDADAEQKYAATVKEEVSVGEKTAYICEVNGERKYILPVRGMGLWGPIWGYIAVNNDGNTVYGAYFNHDSETAGLGAEIKDSRAWQEQFAGKNIFDANGNVVLKVVKKIEDSQSQVDGVTGATLTCNGVNDMFQADLALYKELLGIK